MIERGEQYGIQKKDETVMDKIGKSKNGKGKMTFDNYTLREWQ